MKKLNIILTLFFAVIIISCNNTTNEVVVYTTVDQIFSEPILKDFEKETGIKVKAVYDTEETKSTGAMNRLIAEKNNPQADVYWANEPIRAEVLRQRGVAEAYLSPSAEGIPEVFRDPDGYWTGFSARLRVLILNSSEQEKPHSIFDLAAPEFQGRVVLANPLFGTTTSHIAALFVALGDERGRRFLDSLKANDVRLTTSNGESSDLVSAGHAVLSLVDSDDAVNRMRQGKNITMIYPDQGEDGLGCFIVPNAVMLIKNGPHPEAGKKLIDYLLSRETEQKLAFADCAQIPLHPGVKMPAELKPIDKLKIMKVDYAKVAKKMVEIQPFLREWLGL